MSIPMPKPFPKPRPIRPANAGRSCTTRLLAALSAFLLSVAPAAAQDRQINVDAEGDQESPRVAGLSNDETVFVWAERFPTSIEMRRFDSAGGALDAADVLIAAEAGVEVAKADVAASGAGEFVVAWHEYRFGGVYATEVRARRFADDGTPLGDFFQVNSTTTLSQFLPAVAMRPDGSFMVVWHDGQGDGSGSAISGRRYNSSGLATSGEFRVNTSTAGTQTTPDLAFAPDGSAIVAWSSESVALRRYDPSGTPIGDELTVSEAPLPMPPLLGVGPSVAITGDGTFLVAWPIQEQFHDTIIAARVFDSSGTPVASELILDDVAPQNAEPVAAAVEDAFEVVWHDEVEGSLEIFSRRVSTGGQLLGPPSRVNTRTTGQQRYPHLITRGGEIVAAWGGPDGDFDGVFSNLPAPPEIFADGFESGDVSSWDEAQP